MKQTKVYNINDAVRILKKYTDIRIPTYGFTAAVTGTGSTSQVPFYSLVDTGETAGSTAMLHAYIGGFNLGGHNLRLNFNKLLIMDFIYYITGNNSEFVRYFQFKSANTHGDLAALGIGIKVANLAIIGESYGTERGEVALGNLEAVKAYKITIILTPGIKIEWFINGVLVGTQSTTAKIPTGITPSYAYTVMSVTNGVAAATTASHFSGLRFIQEV